MRRLLVALLLVAGLASAYQPPPAPAPVAAITLGDRQGSGTPLRVGFTHTGGGNIDVQQPAPDAVVITMTGVAVAGGHPCKDSVAALAFDLAQELEVSLDKAEKNRKVRLTLEARLIGLLRSHAHGGGSAGITCPAHVAIAPCGPAAGPVLVEVSMPARSVAGGECLSVNDRRGPVAVVVPPGKFTLHQRFGVQAAHPKKLLPCKTASAEFAPDPALDPLWISAWEPFKGANKKDFGFQVTIRVAPE